MARAPKPGAKNGHPFVPKVNAVELTPIDGLEVPEYVKNDPGICFWFARFGPRAIALGTLNEFTIDSFVEMCRCKAKIERMNAPNAKVEHNRTRASLALELRGLQAEMHGHYQSFGMTAAAVLKAGAVKGPATAPGRGFLEAALPAIEQAKIDAEMANWKPPADIHAKAE